jgi:hypothetical protein
MTRRAITVMAVLLAAAMLNAADELKALSLAPGLVPGTPSTAPAGWTLAYQSDFAKGNTDEWDAAGGKATIKDGALLFEGDADANNELMLKGVKCPGGVRVELVVSGAAEKLSDLSPIINGEGLATGYTLQFGGKANTINQLLKEGLLVEGTSKDSPLLKADQVYHIVAANDGGKISLSVDGAEVFSYTDTSPLQGPDHDRIGVYTYGMKLKIQKVTVYSKPAAPALGGPTTRPVLTADQEKQARQWMGQLGDDNYTVREKATENLIGLGEAAAALVKAKLQEKIEDPEVASRLQLVLKKVTPAPEGTEVTDEASGITVSIQPAGGGNNQVIQARRGGQVIWQTNLGAAVTSLKLLDGQVLVRPSGFVLDVATGRMMGRRGAVN